MTKDKDRVVPVSLSRGEQYMPRSKKKTEDDEIEDLVDTLDELDEIEDEIEDEDVEVEDEDEDIEEDEDDEDEDPDEAPKAKKRTRKTKAAKPAKERTGVGTVEVAAEAGTTPRSLRMFLRARGYQPKDDRDGRYEWPSLRDPQVREIIKAVKAGEAKKINKEKLDDLKARKASKKTTAKATTSKKATAKKRRAKADADA